MSSASPIGNKIPALLVDGIPSDDDDDDGATAPDSCTAPDTSNQASLLPVSDSDSPRTMANPGALKQFFQRKPVLDYFRVYLNVTEDFLAQLKFAGILDDDTFDIILDLGFPANRYELMEVVIRRTWTHEQFDNFCAALKNTQDAGFVHKIVTKAQGYITASEEERLRQDALDMLDDTPCEGYYTLAELEGLDQHKQKSIKARLKAKDDLIRDLHIDNKANKMALESLTQDHTAIKSKFVALDKSVRDVMASIGSADDDGDESMSAGLGSLKDTVRNERKHLVELERDYTKVQADLMQLELKHGRLNREHGEVHEKQDAVNERIEQEREAMKKQLEALEHHLVASKTNNDELQWKVDGLQDIFGGHIRELEHELRVKDKQLSRKAKEVDRAIADRDQARAQIQSIKEQMRKLLRTLGLTNSRGQMSLEKARNISDAMKPAKWKNQGYPDTNDTELDKDLVVEILEMLNAVNDKQLSTGDAVVEELLEAIEAGNDSQQRPISAARSPQLRRPVADHISPNSRRGTLNKAYTSAPNVNIVSFTALSDEVHLPDVKTNLRKIHDKYHSSDSRLTSPSRSRQASTCPNREIPTLLCQVCDRVFTEPSNHDSACMHHAPGASKLYEGTELEVWSCCKSRDTLKGCHRSCHQAVPLDLDPQ